MSRVTPPKRPVAPREPRAVADRPTAANLLLRRYRRFVKPAIIAGAGLVGVLVMVGIARQHADGSIDSMRERIGRLVSLEVQDVVVEGRANTPEPLLRAALGVSRGDPIFGFSVDQARARIESLSWVEHVTVERRLPGTVIVTLREKRPFAIWQNQGKFQLIDRDGQVVTNEDVGNFGNLPLVVGVGAPAHAAAFLDLLAHQPALQSRVVAAVRVGERRWNLRLNNGVDVMLPEGAEDAAMTRLMELQASEALLDRPVGAIDMRLPDRLVIRPASEGHASLSFPWQVS